MKCDTIPDLEKFLSIQEQALGIDTAEVATTALKLGDLYMKEGCLEQAEALYNRTLGICKNLPGFHNEGVEESKHRLSLLAAQKRGSLESHQANASTKACGLGQKNTQKQAGGQLSIAKTKTLIDAAKDAEIELELVRQMVGPYHFSVADLLTKLADLYCRLQMYAEMEPILLDALRIRETICGADHPSVSTELKNLALLYLVQEKYSRAEPLLKRALTLREKSYGRMHIRVADIEEPYAQLLRKTNRIYQAEALDAHECYSN